MLNETLRAWKALRAAKIPLDLPHPLIKPLPVSEKNVLRIRLNDKGQVVSVEDVAAEERRGIHRIVQTSDGSFPVVKVNQPFLSLPLESRAWVDLGKSKHESDKLNMLNLAYAEATNNRMLKTWKGAGWKWSNSLEKARLIVEKLSSDEQATGIVKLARRFERALQNEGTFVLEISRLALTQLRTARLQSLGTVQELLVGKGKDNRGKDKNISVLLVLELDNTGSIHNRNLWQSVANVLPTNLSATERGHKHRAATSAFGDDGKLLEEPFPQVKLPVLGTYFPLISMASDGDKAKCNKRYGLTEYTVCPVTSIESRQMAAALEWLVTRDEGTTWRGVASGKFDKKKEKRDLLIAFVDEKPDIPAKTASYFGSGSEITEGQFEVDAKAVCDALDGMVREHPRSKLNLFLIREASDGQAQVALAESPTVKEVLESAERWQQAMRENTPDVTIYLPEITVKGKKLSAVGNAKPAAPYPDQVVRLLSHQWVRDGSAQQAIVGPGLGEVLILMLRTEGKWELVAQRLLSILLQRVTPLLIGLFAAKHAYGPRNTQGRHEPLEDYLRESRETALRGVAVLGILLDALGLRKENYMKDAPYQVGQMLALADTLHKDYCIVVRDGQLPNSLIGTSLMRRAMDNPKGALDDLAERIMEYLRWAKVAQISDKWEEKDQKRIAVNEARKKLRQYQSLADALGTHELSTECSEGMKAQLLLGFLANPPEED
ncbi:MAG: hypothetical protein FJ012_07405 [Chloroflexi bacterium]|nr:hypothetical protein [Chloroflexota bacterium]